MQLPHELEPAALHWPAPHTVHAKSAPCVPPELATLVALYVPAAQLPPQVEAVYADGETLESYQVPAAQLAHCVLAAAVHALEMYCEELQVEQEVQLVAPVDDE